MTIEKKRLRFKKVVIKSEDNNIKMDYLKFQNLIFTILLAFFLGGLFLEYNILRFFYINVGLFILVMTISMTTLYNSVRIKNKIYYEEIKD